MKRVAILLSGRGSNFLALAQAVEAGRVPAEIVLVASNRPQAPGLEHARRRGCPVASIPDAGLERREHEQRMLEALEAARAEIVCLAGYMRRLSAGFVERYPERILNIHPSLLPAFPGLDAQRQALEWGARVSGCTVHFVDREVDHGPIIVQRPVPVLEGDTVESLSARILEQEHQAYPEALALLCQGRLRIEGRRVRIQPRA